MLFYIKLVSNCGRIVLYLWRRVRARVSGRVRGQRAGQSLDLHLPPLPPPPSTLPKLQLSLGDIILAWQSKPGKGVALSRFF